LRKDDDGGGGDDDGDADDAFVIRTLIDYQ
jgi:hypothetical protein